MQYGLMLVVEIIEFPFYFQESPRDLGLRIDIYDENGIGGGASGVSGGLLHPYSPKGQVF